MSGKPLSFVEFLVGFSKRYGQNMKMYLEQLDLCVSSIISQKGKNICI
jgi:hypothetical protein